MTASLINGIPEHFHQPDTSQLMGELDMTALEGRQFDAVYEALSMAIMGMTGIMNQPRCYHGEVINPAGEYIAALVEFLHTERTRLIETRHHKPAIGEVEQRERMHLLVRYEAECADMNASDLASFVLSFARSH